MAYPPKGKATCHQDKLLMLLSVHTTVPSSGFEEALRLRPVQKLIKATPDK